MSDLKNIVIVQLHVESGCDPRDREYSLNLVSMLTPLDIDERLGDVPLIEECVEEAASDTRYAMPTEGMVEIRLKESGEWEDVFWHKYYEIEEWVIVLDHQANAKTEGGGE